MSDVATSAPPGSSLTAAERRALRAVWQHGSVPRAARSLHRSPATIRSLLANARSRLGVATTMDAIRESGVSSDLTVAETD